MFYLVRHFLKYEIGSRSGDFHNQINSLYVVIMPPYSHKVGSNEQLTHWRDGDVVEPKLCAVVSTRAAKHHGRPEIIQNLNS